ncbi:MAG TPA: urate hydroxylase PuuD, partial [Roseiflexaceae bacterium]|nr:urate hydroxylase PuuD [Roseiflexaceae bacterium]
TARELLDLFVRWVHVIAGIMWIGNSLLFNWLDRNLRPVEPAKEGVQGKIWLLHSGAFYEAEKKLLPAGFPYPEKVHWFMFQNLTTWVSGVSLLILVYYMGGAAYMIDPAVAPISATTAILIGIASIVGSWFVYDLLWRSPLGKNAPVALAVSFALLIGLTYALTHVLSGRAAYIHIGAMLGTLMTANVWFYVIPSQRELVAATRAGLAQDPALSQRAKQRSIHNNYMTFPVIFIMISNHYPSTFGHNLNWLILAVLMVGSALVRHFMNIRFHYTGWLRAAAAAGLISVAIVGILIAAARGPIANAGAPVPFADAQAVIERRCVACHSAHPTDDVFKAPPAGIRLDSPERIQQLAARIKERAVIQKTMPLGNKTGMTDDERALLGRWIDQGANP